MSISINTDKPYKIFAEVLEQEAISQFENAMQQSFVVKGALMPDAHTGYALPIGAVVATRNAIVPSWVGYDIGCGMCALKIPHPIEEIKNNASKIFGNIYRDIPTGFSHNKTSVYWPESDSIPRSSRTEEIFDKNGLLQIGTLGSGNHFIEIGYDESNSVWIIIHSGSRGIGHAVATHYMKLASGDGRAREGHFYLDVESDDGKNYIMDLNFCLSFALENRRELLRRVVGSINHSIPGSYNTSFENIINRNHNHAENKDGLWIHRKGATHADADMYGVIPGNMRDGSFIVRGKGNPDSICSSSHGAGRVLSRKKAKEILKVEDFSKAMCCIKAKVSTSTIDESPFAYKNIFDVMALQKDLVEVVTYVKPIINIKG